MERTDGTEERETVGTVKKTIFKEMGGDYIRRGILLSLCLTLQEEENLIFL